MLDVHPPHEPTHTWTDFFIHISTICVGLLIAIGLEQSVEAIHRHGERSDLVESLQHESEQILRDAIRVETAVSAEVQWQRQVGAAVAVANSSHQPIGEIPAAPAKDFDVPGNPIYKAARASNKLTLLSQEEAEAYGELNTLIERVDDAYRHRVDAMSVELETQNQLRFSRQLGSAPSLGALDLSAGLVVLRGITLPEEDLKQIFKDTIHL